MRSGARWTSILACTVALATSADAQPASHVALGEQLAREGRMDEAVIEFKRADRIERRARHACLIALAYMRRDAWSQAELFLERCHQRATASDPIPGWLGPIEQEFRARMARAAVASVEITVMPAAAAANTEIAISSFLPDERFGPRRLHLAHGTHVVTAHRPGLPPVERVVEIRSNDPQRVDLVFDQTATSTSPPGIGSSGGLRDAGPRDGGPRRSNTASTILIASGGATVVAGALYHLFAYKPARDKLESLAADEEMYDAYEDTYDRRRIATVALYGAGVALAVTGLVLRYTAREPSAGPQFVGSIAGDGITVGVRWTR